MVLREVTIVLGILGFCCSSSFAVNCYDKNSMMRAQRRCFTSQGLQLNLGSQDLQTAVQNDPEEVCQKKEQYRPALRCALDISRRCIVQLGQNPDIIPDADRAMDGLSYVCNNYDNINTTCVKDKNAAMQMCVVHKATTSFAGSSSHDVVGITCKAFEIAVDCMKESLTTCSGQTKNILVHYTQTYLTPTACGNHYSPMRVTTTKSPVSFTTKSPVWMTTMAPVSTFTLVTGMPSLPHASCYDKDSIQEAQQRCFSQEGLHVVLPDITLGNGRRTKQSYLDALMSNNRDFKTMCQNQLAQYQRAMYCAMEVARQCMPIGYKGYLPSGRQVQGLLVDLCTHYDDINQTCVLSKAGDLFDCGYRKGLSLRGRDTKSLLCSAFKFNAVCQKEELRSCGCKTASLYVRMSKEHLNPSSCPPISVIPDDCSQVSKNGHMQIAFKPLDRNSQQNGNRHRGSEYHSYEHMGNQHMDDSDSNSYNHASNWHVDDDNAATTSQSTASIGLLAIGTLLAYRIFM